MQQNPDGSVSTQGVTAERPPTWGELQDHVASTGASLLPATPAQQPPPRPQPQAAPPPEAAAPSPAPAPAALTPAQQGALTSLEQVRQEITPARPTARYLVP